MPVQAYALLGSATVQSVLYLSIIVSLLLLVVLLLLIGIEALRFVRGLRKRLEGEPSSPATGALEITFRKNQAGNQIEGNTQSVISNDLNEIAATVRHLKEYVRNAKAEDAQGQETTATVLSGGDTDAGDIHLDEAPPKLEELRDVYNRVVNKQSDRASFTGRFRPIRIGVVNVGRRRADERIEPVFETADNGTLLAISDGSERDFMVFPGFDLIVEELEFGPGAVGYVFECKGYKRRHRHRCAELVRPASFVQAVDGRWKCKSKGTLVLREDG